MMSPNLEYIVPDPLTLIDLLRSLIHHNLSSLIKSEDAKKYIFDDFASLSGQRQKDLAVLLQDLDSEHILKQPLLLVLAHWKSLDETGRYQFLSILSEHNLVVNHSHSKHGGTMDSSDDCLLCFCRLYEGDSDTRSQFYWSRAAGGNDWLPEACK